MMNFMRMRAAVLVALIALLVSASSSTASAKVLIRDAEIEGTIRTWATPLFAAAGLNAADIRIFIINDSAINAFVAGGMNLFIHTGLLVRSKSPGEVIGVVAHETGHISGGHLARFSRQVNTSSNAALVATILGVLTAVATGSGEAGAAIVQGGQGLALGSILNYSRAQEAAADQAGLRFMDETGESAAGLRSFLGRMENEELLTEASQSAYMRTHPVTRDRIRLIDEHLAHSPFTNKPVKRGWVEMHRRMVTKLTAFLERPETVLEKYPATDTSVAARYARAIALYRLAALDKALPLIDGLIKQEPDNPYFYELKGQMLFENGRIGESLAPNAQAVRLAPEEGTLRVALARSQIEGNVPGGIKAAIGNLLVATRLEPERSFAWDQLAVAYGRDGQIGLSALSQAESAMAQRKFKEALDYAMRAERRLKSGSTGWTRVQDIKNTAKEEIRRAGNR